MQVLRPVPTSAVSLRYTDEHAYRSKECVLSMKPCTGTPGLSETGLSEKPIYPTLHRESPSLFCVQSALVYPTPGLSDTWFIQHLIYPTPGLSNTWFIQHLVYPTPDLSNTWFIQHLVYPTPGLSNT